MQGEIVTVVTADRTRLHGFRVEASSNSTSQFDGAVITHGLAGNFYSSPLLTAMATRFAELGIETVIGNNRGHDFLNWTLQSGRTTTIGAAMEDVDDCRHDLTAWVDYLVRNGCQRILLAGHSLGAIKSLYTQAIQAHPAVAGIAAVSPTRLNHDQFLASPSGDLFRQTMNNVREKVAAGKGNELIQVEFPFPTWMTPLAYLKKYGPENRFDWCGIVDQIAVPAGIWFGSRELGENAAFAGLQNRLDEVARSHPLFEIRTIEGADHFYIAHIESLCSELEKWIARQCFEGMS